MTFEEFIEELKAATEVAAWMLTADDDMIRGYRPTPHAHVLCPITAVALRKGLGVFSIMDAGEAGKELGLDDDVTNEVIYGADNQEEGFAMRIRLLEALGLKRE